MTHPHPPQDAAGPQPDGFRRPTANGPVLRQIEDQEEPSAARGLPVQSPGGSCPPAGATETAAEIAARYGAGVKAGVSVKRIAAGVSGLPPLIWDDGRGLVYATKPDLQRLTFGVGKPPKAVTASDGRTWRSMGDLARHLGVSLCAVSKAVKKGKVDDLIARHERRAA